MGQILFTAYPFEPFEFLIRKNVLPSQKQTFKRKNKVSIPYSCISSRQLFLNNECAGTNINCDTHAVGVPGRHLRKLRHGIHSGTCLVCSGEVS